MLFSFPVPRSREIGRNREMGGREGGEERGAVGGGGKGGGERGKVKKSMLVEGERGELRVTEFRTCMSLRLVRLSMMIVTREILPFRFPSDLAVKRIKENT